MIPLRQCVCDHGDIVNIYIYRRNKKSHSQIYIQIVNYILKPRGIINKMHFPTTISIIAVFQENGGSCIFALACFDTSDLRHLHLQIPTRPNSMWQLKSSKWLLSKRPVLRSNVHHKQETVEIVSDNSYLRSKVLFSRQLSDGLLLRSGTNI